MRYDLQSNQPLDDLSDGDVRFVSQNLKAPKEYLSAGTYSNTVNKRLVRGVQTRPGTRTPLYANLFSASGLLGSGRYRNPNGYEYGLLATTKNGTSQVIAIRNGTVETNFSFQVEFAQHFDKVLAHQSDPSGVTQFWDGLSDEGLVALIPPVQSLIDIGILQIPNAPWSVHLNGRAWMPDPENPDTMIASDENNPMQYDSILHKFRVNTGSSDSIVGAYPFLSSNLIIGKQNSIDILADIPGDLGDAFLGGGYGAPPPPRTVIVSTEIGIVARKSGLLAGGVFMFLSDAGEGGIYQLITDQHGNYQVDPVPVSDE